MNKMILAAALLFTTQAQAYTAKQEYILFMSRVVSSTVGVELYCDAGLTANPAFFKLMYEGLDMDQQDLELVSRLSSGKRVEIEKDIEKLGIGNWCASKIAQLQHPVDGITPLESK